MERISGQGSFAAVDEPTVHSYSRALCPHCRALVDATRVIRDDRVYLRKQCPEHGVSEALISGDAEWFSSLPAYARPGLVPHGFSTELSVPGPGTAPRYCQSPMCPPVPASL